jgi:hypothetical protein
METMKMYKEVQKFADAQLLEFIDSIGEYDVYGDGVITRYEADYVDDWNYATDSHCERKVHIKIKEIDSPALFLWDDLGIDYIPSIDIDEGRQIVKEANNHINHI